MRPLYSSGHFGQSGKITMAPPRAIPSVNINCILIDFNLFRSSFVQNETQDAILDRAFKLRHPGALFGRPDHCHLLRS